MTTRLRAVETERKQLRRESNDAEFAHRIRMGIIQRTLLRSDQGLSPLPRNRPQAVSNGRCRDQPAPSSSSLAPFAPVGFLSVASPKTRFPAPPPLDGERLGRPIEGLHEPTLETGPTGGEMRATRSGT